MGARVGDAEEADAISDINVTPLVDVVLVLLIVFMITVPALVGSAPVQVDLPTTAEIATALEQPESLPLKVFVRQDAGGEAKVYLGEHIIAIANFKNFLNTLGNIDKESPVQIAADQGLPYRDVVSVMDSLSSVGIHKISLETKHVEATP
jgi:biopolymer transport protein ExbD